MSGVSLNQALLVAVGSLGCAFVASAQSLDLRSDGLRSRLANAPAATRSSVVPQPSGILLHRASTRPIRLELMPPSSGKRSRAAIVGAAVGAVAGGSIFYALCMRDDCMTPAPILIGALKGAALGGSIGWIIGSLSQSGERPTDALRSP